MRPRVNANLAPVPQNNRMEVSEGRAVEQLSSNFDLRTPLSRKRLIIPNPFCMRPAPMMRPGSFGEIVVCGRDRFTIDYSSRSAQSWAVSNSSALLLRTTEHPRSFWKTKLCTGSLYSRCEEGSLTNRKGQSGWCSGPWFSSSRSCRHLTFVATGTIWAISRSSGAVRYLGCCGAYSRTIPSSGRFKARIVPPTTLNSAWPE